MLISKHDLSDNYHKKIEKVKNIIDIRNSAPKDFQKNTEHLSSLSTVFPYIYYISIVKKYLKDPSSKILDWGAYLGQVTYLLQDDFSINAYNPAIDKSIQYWHRELKIKESSFSSLNKNEYFDAVISSGVLEHSFEYGIEDVYALQNLNKMLKPNGFLFIWNLPNKNSLPEMVARKKRKWRHIVRYELDEILMKLNLTGFDIVEIEMNEIIFSKLAKIFKNNLVEAWNIDNKICKIPIVKKFSHNFTIVARKIKGFPIKPAISGYTTYI